MMTQITTSQLSVEASAAVIRHYRFAEERVMRMLAGWIARTPELPAKLLFGRQVWDCAQHANAWGRRLPELRARSHDSQPATPRFASLLDRVESAQGPTRTLERLVGVYLVIKPHLISAYQMHLAGCSPLYETPTRRLLEQMIEDETRHVASAGALLTALLESAAPSRVQQARDWEMSLLEHLKTSSGVAGNGHVDLAPSISESAAAPPDAVMLSSHFDPACIPVAVAEVLQYQKQALLSGDLAPAAEWFEPTQRARLLAVYATLEPPCASVEIVAHARVGAYRFCKLLAARGDLATEVLLELRPVGQRFRLVNISIQSTHELHEKSFNHDH